MHQWKLTFRGLCGHILQRPLGTIVAVHLKLQLLGGALRGENIYQLESQQKKQQVSSKTC